MRTKGGQEILKISLENRIHCGSSTSHRSCGQSFRCLPLQTSCGSEYTGAGWISSFEERAKVIHPCMSLSTNRCQKIRILCVCKYGGRDERMKSHFVTDRHRRTADRLFTCTGSGATKDYTCVVDNYHKWNTVRNELDFPFLPLLLSCLDSH